MLERSAAAVRAIPTLHKHNAWLLDPFRGTDQHDEDSLFTPGESQTAALRLFAGYVHVCLDS